MAINGTSDGAVPGALPPICDRRVELCLASAAMPKSGCLDEGFSRLAVTSQPFSRVRWQTGVQRGLEARCLPVAGSAGSAQMNLT